MKVPFISISQSHNNLINIFKFALQKCEKNVNMVSRQVVPSNTYTYNGLEEQLNIPYKMLVLAGILYSLLSDHKLKLGLSFLTYKGKVGGCPWNF